MEVKAINILQGFSIAEFICSVFSAPIPGYSDAAVRRLSLKSEISAKKSDYSELKDVDENCERTGFGLKAWITSGIDPFDPAFQAYLLAQSGKRLDNCTNFHHFGTGLPHVKIGCHLELGKFEKNSLYASFAAF